MCLTLHPATSKHILPYLPAPQSSAGKMRELEDGWRWWHTLIKASQIPLSVDLVSKFALLLPIILIQICRSISLQEALFCRLIGLAKWGCSSIWLAEHVQVFWAFLKKFYGPGTWILYLFSRRLNCSLLESRFLWLRAEISLAVFITVSFRLFHCFYACLLFYAEYLISSEGLQLVWRCARHYISVNFHL